MASDSSQSRWLRSNFMAVQTAFLFFGLFPPPAPRPRVFTCGHRPRARRAADRAVALVVKRVVRHFVGPDVVPDVCLAPIRQRVELLHTVFLIPCFKGNFGAKS